MWFYIDQTSHVPVYKQICDRVKEMVISGKIKPGDFVPSIRKLAKDLGVNVNTVARAYRELVNEGVLQPVKGEGYTVREIGEDFVKEKLEDLQKILINLRTMGVKKNEVLRIIEEVFRDDLEG